jgi:hypothetical protein
MKPESEWDILTKPCEGCGAPTRYPRNYPNRRLCLECAVGLLPPEARASGEQLIDLFGLRRRQ